MGMVNFLKCLGRNLVLDMDGMNMAFALKPITVFILRDLIQVRYIHLITKQMFYNQVTTTSTGMTYNLGKKIL